MNKLILVPIFLPIIMGALIWVFKFKERKHRELYISTVIIIDCIIVWLIALLSNGAIFRIENFGLNMSLCLKPDGMSKMFSCLVATLWIPASIYAFEYMDFEQIKEKKDVRSTNSFFAFYTMTLGVVIGLAYSGNPLTMYFFFEALSLITLPLIIYSMSNRALRAGRRYLKYMLGGAAFGLIGIVFLIYYGETDEFVYGGMIDFSKYPNMVNIFLAVYVIAFVGFAVKAAIFPFGHWLISAAVAPTPVTALLHAVAVVKSGVFVVMRITYFCFGAENISGTWAHYVVLTLVLITILYGSVMAVKEQHLKRRLAYSTISNLSYIMFGVVMMSKAGLIAAFCHLIFHAFMKISAFFGVGTIMQRTDKNYVDEINGIGKSMPLVMICFTISSLSLIGIPPFAGFVSKWLLGEAAIQSGNKAVYFGVIVLLIAALLTAFYTLQIVIRAFFAHPSGNENERIRIRGSAYMYGPLVFFSICIVLLGVFSEQLISIISKLL